MKITALLLVAAAFSLPAQAETISRCVLEVDGVSYLDGPCDFDGHDKGGSFTISVNDPLPYFATVDVGYDPISPDAVWNGPNAESHAHDYLGELTRDGACWVNESVKVCAYR